MNTYEVANAQDHDSTAAPFLLASAKGFTGHSEAAAGAAGLTEAIFLAAHARAAPALHLRHLNPHVAGVLGGAVTAKRPAAILRGGADPVPSGVPCCRDLAFAMLRHCLDVHVHAQWRLKAWTNGRSRVSVRPQVNAMDWTWC